MCSHGSYAVFFNGGGSHGVEEVGCDTIVSIRRKHAYGTNVEKRFWRMAGIETGRGGTGDGCVAQKTATDATDYSSGLRGSSGGGGGVVAPDGEESQRLSRGITQNLGIELWRVGDWEEQGVEAFEGRKEGRGAGFEGDVWDQRGRRRGGF